MVLNNEETAMQRFYNGKRIFITGGTGFMGKMLIEKLLRSCPGVETIYLLVRQKKGQDVYSRIEIMFDDPIFERLICEGAKFRHKIVTIPGDCSQAGLGISFTDIEMLSSTVDLVFHVAATVRFTEKLRTALAINVYGVRDVMMLCRNMKNLKALIHVSTAYSNSNLDYVDEKFYSFPMKLDELETLIDKLDDQQIDYYLPKILGDWPNTYTFTKALAESMIREQSYGLNIGIFRPAIVTATASEPVEGWVDNYHGLTGVLHGIGAGILRTIHCDGKLNAEMVPVDFCVNAVLSLAWDVANNAAERQGDNIPIYNYVSSVENTTNWKEFILENFKNGFTSPFSGAMWYSCFHINKSAAVNNLYRVFLHYIPAFLFDSFALCVGRKPWLLKTYYKIHEFSNVISYFATRRIRFSNNNVQALWNKLEIDDQKIFNFSLSSLDWREYFKIYMRGIRKYLIKEDDSTLESARRQWKWFYYLHQCVKLTLFCLFLFTGGMIYRNLF